MCTASAQRNNDVPINSQEVMQRTTEFLSPKHLCYLTPNLFRIQSFQKENASLKFQNRKLGSILIDLMFSSEREMLKTPLFLVVQKQIIMIPIYSDNVYNPSGATFLTMCQ